MNAIVTKNRIDFYNNLTKNARFMYTEYDMAVNTAILQFVDEKLGDRMQRNPENFQWIQQIRSDISTLIKTSAPTVTPGTAFTNRYYTILPMTFPVPADYYDFICLFTLIDAYTSYARPTTFNEKGPLFEDSFRHPTNKKVYFNDTAAGWVIYRANTGTFTSAALDYIKFPTSFTIGPEASLISGGGTLTNALAYYATEISVYNGTTYQIGASITGTGAALTSGQVILVSFTAPIDLPEKVHDEICRLSSMVMLKSIGEYQESVAVESERSKA